jgi:hypothetical protein
LPLRELAASYSLSVSALQRHKGQHIPAAISQVVQAREIGRADSLFDHVRGLQARSAAILEKAESSGDLRAALAALRELRGILELLARLATRNGTMVEIAIVEEYVSKIFDILYEFVPEDRLSAAIAKLNEAVELEALRAASPAGTSRRSEYPGEQRTVPAGEQSDQWSPAGTSEPQ